jgi:hypothetical protein
MKNPINSSRRSTTSWTNIQAQEPEVVARSSEDMITSPFKLTGDSGFTKSDHFPNFQGM